jgi:hypothetical protein
MQHGCADAPGVCKVPKIIATPLQGQKAPYQKGQVSHEPASGQDIALAAVPRGTAINNQLSAEKPLHCVSQ